MPTTEGVLSYADAGRMPDPDLGNARYEARQREWSDVKILLDDAEMDAQLGRTLIAVAAEGCDLGEALATAARTSAGDADGWYAQWSATAQADSASTTSTPWRGRCRARSSRSCWLRPSRS